MADEYIEKVMVASGVPYDPEDPQPPETEVEMETADESDKYVKYADEAGEAYMADWSYYSNGALTYYGTCSTPANDPIKRITITNEDENNRFRGVPGAECVIRFEYTNTANNPEIAIGDTVYRYRAPIYYDNAVATDPRPGGTAGRYTRYMYDGRYWVWIGEGSNEDLDSLDLNTDELSDNDLFVTKEAGGTAWVKKSLLKIWNYIKSKIQASSNEVAYGTCSTAAATAAKVITLDTASNWKLKKGTIVCIKFTNTNTAQNPTLNVNNSGAKSIYYNTAVITTGSLFTAGEANRFTSFMYDGTNWVWIGSSIDRNTTYSAMSTSELTTGTATSSRVVRADYLHNGIEKIAESSDIDTADNTATFTSSDTTDANATSWTSVTKLDSGESHASIFAKMSQMFKNIRYLYKILGTTDVSSFFGGSNQTVTSALSTLNTHIGSHTVAKDVPSNAVFTDTTYGMVSKTANGLAPQLPNETTTTKYLRQDGTWVVPPDTKKGNSITTNAAKTGSGTTVTSTIAANTTMDNAIGTLLNNDVALNASLKNITTYTLTPLNNANLDHLVAYKEVNGIKHINGWASITSGSINAGASLNIATLPSAMLPSSDSQYSFSVGYAYDEYNPCLMYINGYNLQIYKPTKTIPANRVVAINMTYI